MKYVEIILQCLTALIRVIFPRKEKVPQGNLVPHGHPSPGRLPVPPLLPLPPAGGDGGDASGDRGDSLPPQIPPAISPVDTDWLGLSGYTLMIAGGIGCVLRYLLG